MGVSKETGLKQIFLSALCNLSCCPPALQSHLIPWVMDGPSLRVSLRLGQPLAEHRAHLRCGLRVLAVDSIRPDSWDSHGLPIISLAFSIL